MSTLEYDLVRLTAQSAQQDPKHVKGGSPEYTRADILACAAEMPHLAWHCLLAKCCGDELSERELLRRVKAMAVQEWATNPTYALQAIQAGQLMRVAELAVLAYLNPHCPHALSYGTRAAYARCSHEKWRGTFQAIYTWLLREIDDAEAIGARAYRARKFGAVA